MSDQIGERILGRLGEIQKSLNTCVWLLVVIADYSIAAIIKLW